MRVASQYERNSPYNSNQPVFWIKMQTWTENYFPLWTINSLEELVSVEEHFPSEQHNSDSTMLTDFDVIIWVDRLTALIWMMILTYSIRRITMFWAACSTWHRDVLYRVPFYAGSRFLSALWCLWTVGFKPFTKTPIYDVHQKLKAVRTDSFVSFVVLDTGAGTGILESQVLVLVFGVKYKYQNYQNPNYCCL